jgi:FMN phosphatase YigB (HAD superfamily)
LSKNYQTVLITDNMDCFTRFIVPAQKLEHFFDVIVNSFENKKLKEHNDGEIFMQLIEKQKTKIEDCILIDNSKKICALFTKLGGKACCVTSEFPLDYWLVMLKK